MNKNDICSAITKEKIIAVIRRIEGDKLDLCAEALNNGGICLAELPFDASDEKSFSQTAAEIGRLSAKFEGRLIVGAGTVLSAEQVKLAASAGARFIVSPNTDEKVIDAAKNCGLVSIPGAMTPSEICRANSLGADFVKVFPAGCLGLSYFRAVTTPLSHIRLLAVGGIEVDDVRGYLECGVCGFGISTKILSEQLVENGDYSGIERRAKAYVDAVSQL